MSSQEPIDKLFVSIEADVKELIEKGEAAIKQVNRELDKLDKKGKKVGRFQKLKKGLDGVVKGLRAAQAAALAFGAAIVAAFRLAQQAVREVRIEQSFFRIAAAAEQSGTDILNAIRKASKNTISDMEAMRVANLALQLQVARTPEDFEKLTRAAVRLGGAMGTDAVTAMEELTSASGRASKMILDNLGLSVSEVNALMEEFAQQEFGRTADELDEVNKRMIFIRATIEASDRKAKELGDTLSGVGAEMDQLVAQSANFQSELGQTSLVLFGLFNQLGEGPGFLQRLTDGAIAWQMILIEIAALVMTIGEGLKATGQNMLALLGRAERATFNFGDVLGQNLTALQARFQDILDPEAAAEGLGVIPGPTIDPDPTDESAQEIRDILDDLATDLLNEQDDTDRALEELAEDHAERMADIAEEGAKKRIDIEEDTQRDLMELAQDTAEQRAEIFKDTQRDLEELARDTDARLEDERDDFQTEERRDTEDHLREMRRLTQQHLLDLEDAVKERDARAVVDLQRRFALEQADRQEDFNVTQGRGREDSSQRLAEIRDDEAQRREEILRSQAEELSDLMQHEQQRRAEIELSRQEQLTRLDEQLTEARARENENFAERQADLQNALAERLQAIAKELADEDKINEEGARNILSTLANFFGVGGEIDRLMEDFQRRRTQRMTIDVQFDATTRAQGLRQERGRGPLPTIPRFQRGGQMVARKPTLAMFGEGGPELATFTPMNQTGGGAPKKLQIEFTGSAPPGIRSPERDQIAAVLMDALRDTGALSR